MATAAEYAQWIVNNPDKKGTPEFQTVANAYQAAKIKEGQAKGKQGFFEQQFNEMADAGVGVIGEGAKFVGRILPGVTGEELQAKTEKALTPKGKALLPEAVQTGRLISDVGLGFAMPVARGASLLARTGTGAFSGGATAGLINPEDIGAGAVVGGLAANIPQAFNYLTSRGSKRLMQSAIKPSVADLQSGNVQPAIQTMLEEGVNPTQGRTIFGRGLDTLQKKVTNLNTQISDIIKNSKGSVNKNTVVSYLDDLEKKAMMQVAPESDLSAIRSVREQFLAHPLAQGDTIPIQLAQELKKGTYKSLGGKAYGEVSSASKEAQKGIARGLKEGISQAEPLVANLNKQESKLLNALNVAERRALIEANKDIFGLGSISPTIERTLAFLADRNSAFKSLLARIMYRAGQIGAPKGGLLNVPSATVGQANE